MPTSPFEPPRSGFPHGPLPHNERFRLLPDLNRLLLTYSDLREAFPRICRRLHRVLAHQHAAIALYEPKSAKFRIYVQHSQSGGSLPESLTLQQERTPCGEVYRLRQPIVVDDLRSPQFASETTQELLKHGRRSGCWAPLQTADHVLGALSISVGRPGAYRVEDAHLLNEVAGQISLALASQLGLQQLQALQLQLEDQIHDWNRSFRDIAATAACGVVQWGADGIVSDANDVFLRMVGRTREDIQAGLNCSELTPKGEYLGLRRHAEEGFHDHGSFEPFQLEYQRPDGIRVPVLVSAGLLNQKRPPWLTLVVDLGAVRLTAEPRFISPEIEPIATLEGSQAQTFPGLADLPTLLEVERDHITRVLRNTHGVVGGEHGAASILGIKRTTLQYKMKKLDIPHG